MSRREQFEAWFENDVVDKKVTFPAFEGGEYTEGDLYDDQLYFMLQAMWMAWQAASKASEQQLAAVVAENAGLKQTESNLVRNIINDLGDTEFQYSRASTPATDAYLAEVLEQSVSELIAAFSKHVSASGLNDSSVVTILECKDAMQHVAAQLRQGAAL